MGLKEIVEWASLIEFLASIRLHNRNDKWVWNLEKDGSFSFTTESLVYSLTKGPSANNSYTYKAIWEDCYSKNVKLLLWEFSHSCLNTQDRLQLQHSQMFLSPNWCCLCNAENQSQNHIFIHCQLSSKFGHILFDRFQLVHHLLTPISMMVVAHSQRSSLQEGKEDIMVELNQSSHLYYSE